MPAPRFKIEYIDGREPDEVKLLPKAQLRFESKTGKSLGKDFGEKVSDLYSLAWFAAGEPGDSLEDWLEDIEAVTGVDVEGEDEAAAVDPPSPEVSPD